jgi:hypothetical protein
MEKSQIQNVWKRGLKKFGLREMKCHEEGKLHNEYFQN